MKKYLFIVIVSFCSFKLSAQRMTVEQYIETYKELAMEEMIQSGIPASITLAQGILESEYGNSRLAREGNNHFGIKCKETWTGPTIHHTDDAPWECFRKYGSAEESYRDHSEFLKTRSHYAFLFTLDILDYKAWAYGLKKAGYATSPRYPISLIESIEKHNLHQYSLLAMNRKEQSGNVVSFNIDSSSNVNDKIQFNNNKSASTILIPEGMNHETKSITYPEGVFEINRTKVIYAKAGTSWLAIANEHKVSLHHLFEFNEITEQETLLNDQLVFLSRKRKKGSVEFHTVKTGESIHTIAQLEGIRLESLLEYNYLKSEQILTKGTILYLQDKAPRNEKLSGNKDQENRSGGK